MFSLKKIVIVPILLLTLLFFLKCKYDKKAPLESNVIDRPIQAPDFTLVSLNNDTINLNSFKGKYVVLHIAATWCPFCNAEAPHLENLYQDYKDHNVVVLLMDVKESRQLVQEKLMDKYELSFPIVLDIDGSAAASFAPKDILPDLARDEVMLASNILIDPEGNIQFMSLLDSKNFDAELKELKKRLDELL
ncbi:peroxiredoxin family protein [Flavobacteriaceae bacterium LMO-SS05]